MHAFNRSISTVVAVLGVVFVPLLGCDEGYTVPMRGADLRAFGAQPLDLSGSHEDREGAGTLQPLATFPATIAVVRVQGSDFQSRYDRAYDRGWYSIVATRDVEVEHRLAEFASQPQIRAIVPVNHLAVPNDGGSTALRQAARSLGADMLLIYTLDSATQVDHHVPELSALTLGMLPEGEARARCTASAILTDARSGYVYAVAEGTDEQKRLASAWSSESGSAKAKRAAEQQAFEQLVTNLKTRWAEVVQQYAAK